MSRDSVFYFPGPDGRAEKSPPGALLGRFVAGGLLSLLTCK